MLTKLLSSNPYKLLITLKGRADG